MKNDEKPGPPGATGEPCVRCPGTIEPRRLILYPKARFCAKCAVEMELHRTLHPKPGTRA